MAWEYGHVKEGGWLCETVASEEFSLRDDI